jgi:hypothetical protein
MLTLQEKVDIGRRNEWQSLVQTGMTQVATERLTEKTGDITFGTYASDLLIEAAIPGLREQEQNKAHLIRVAYAREILTNTANIQQNGQTLSLVLIASIVEETTLINQNTARTLTAALKSWYAFLTRPTQPSRSVSTQQKISDTPFPASELAIIEGQILTVLRRLWNGLSGYNPNYEIPKAIAEALDPPPE